MENNDFKIEFENTVPPSDEETLENQNTEEKRKKFFDLKKEIKEWVSSIVIALVIVFVLKGFFFDIVKVDGHSMDPTLAHGQHLILRKIGYTPKRGDIIVLDANYKSRMAVVDSLDSGFEKFMLKHEYYTQSKYDLKPYCYIKRVIGLPGDEVFIDLSGDVYINGELLEENYIQGTTMAYAMINNPCIVEEGHVFVMGDNRENSSDSRFPSLGTVPFDAVWGEASFRIWPLNKIGSPY